MLKLESNYSKILLRYLLRIINSQINCEIKSHYHLLNFKGCAINFNVKACYEISF